MTVTGYYWIEERGRELHLHGLVVKGDFQGKGIGTQTLQMLWDEHKDTKDFIELGVRQNNTGAIRLYQRLGYQIVQTLQDYGFYVMRKGEAYRSTSEAHTII